MATKSSDAILRIRAKNLARKDMQGVADDLDAIAENQKKNATAAGLASRAMRELTDEQRALVTVSKELERRRDLIEQVLGSPAEMQQASQRVRQLREELAKLRRDKASGTALGDTNKAIREAETNLRQANRELVRQQKNFDKARDAAKSIGIPMNDLKGSLHGVNAQIERTADLTRNAERAAEGYEDAVREQRAALESQEQAQREITEEAKRRNRVEEDAARRRRDEAAQRAAELHDQARIRDELTKRFQAHEVAAQHDVTAEVQRRDKIEREAASRRRAEAAERSAELREQARIREDLTRRFSGPQYAPEDPRAAAELARSAAFRERLVNVMRRQKDGGERLIRTQRELRAAANDAAGAVDRQTRAVRKAKREQGLFNDVGRKSLSVYQRMRGQLLFMASAYLGFYEAIRLVQSSFDIEQQRIAIGIQMNVANNDDPRAAAEDIAYLRSEADRLGQVYEDVAKGYANYKIAARAVGASNKTVRESFSQGLEIVTALRLSTDQAGLVFRAFTQILGKSRVQAEELRNQLGDALPGAVSEFAKSLVSRGIIDNITELDSYFKKGTGGIEDFFNFLTDYAKKTDKAAEEAAKTTLANVRRMTNAFRDFQQTFMSSGAGTAISDVVAEITKALRGREGEELAKGLATAFVIVAKAVLFCIENFEELVTVLKWFLGFQLVKAIYGIVGSTVLMGNQAWNAAKKVGTFTKSLAALRMTSSLTSVTMTGLMSLMGPLGIAVAALGGIFFELARGIENSKNRMQEFEDALDDVRLAKTAEETDAATGTLAQQLIASKARVAAIDEARANARSLNLSERFAANNKLVAESIYTQGDYEERISQEMAIQQGLLTGIATARRKHLRLTKEEEKALAASNAEQDDFVRPPPDGEDGSAGSAADKRVNIARAVKKELLQLEQEILDARLNGEATTVEQINEIYSLRMQQIEAMIAEKALEIDKLAQQAADAGTLAVHQDELDLMGEKLLALKRALNMQQIEKSTAEELALLQKQINDEITKRDGRIEAINELVEAGQITEIEGVRRVAEERVRSAAVAMEAIRRLLAFAATVEDPELREKLGLDQIVEDAELLVIQLQTVETVMDLVAKNIAGQLAGGIASALGTLARGIAGAVDGVNGIADAFKNAGRAFLDFLADFLVGIGEAIMQAILLEAILRAFGKGTGGSWADIAIGALTAHSGGVVGTQGVGSGNQTRTVSPMVFAAAQKFHTGGLPGLKANEVPIIAKKGEEVLAENDPRNILNGGFGGGNREPRVDLAIHNSIDAESVLAAAAKTTGGRKVIFNAIKADVAQYRRLLGAGS